jgi:hypothetical protein
MVATVPKQIPFQSNSSRSPVSQALDQTHHNTYLDLAFDLFEVVELVTFIIFDEWLGGLARGHHGASGLRRRQAERGPMHGHRAANVGWHEVAACRAAIDFLVLKLQHYTNRNLVMHRRKHRTLLWWRVISQTTVLPTSKMSVDSEIYGLAKHFLEHSMPTISL